MQDIDAVVLGIDAAWTLKNPSGVALAVRRGRDWQAVAAASSYNEFTTTDRQSGIQAQRPAGSAVDLAALLAAAQQRCGKTVDVIAVDMPLAMSPIVTRRTSDNLISKSYGARKCSTHTPGPDRPGPISVSLHEQASQQGYPLIVDGHPRRGLIEVYPHPALVELAQVPERLPYKVSNIGKYWQELNGIKRRERLIEQWHLIARVLEQNISGCRRLLALPEMSAPIWQLKAYEDKLDALVCTVVAAYFLEGRCRSFGDADSAIWVPVPRETNPATDRRALSP